jgi:hypothetical protein
MMPFQKLYNLSSSASIIIHDAKHVIVFAAQHANLTTFAAPRLTTTLQTFLLGVVVMDVEPDGCCAFRKTAFPTETFPISITSIILPIPPFSVPFRAVGLPLRFLAFTSIAILACPIPRVKPPFSHVLSLVLLDAKTHICFC